jgi:hypothetical protein
MPGGPSPGYPAHPIAPGGPPLQIWGGAPPTYPDIGFPAPQPPPLGIWGGGGVGNYPDAGFPVPQPPRPPQIWGGPYYPPQIWKPTFPTNPIVIPLPPQTGGGDKPHIEHPIVIPPGVLHPSHPIVIVPPDPPEGAKPPPADGGWGFAPGYGWGYFPPGGGKPQPQPPA